jgi:hypothetical protein
MIVAQSLLLPTTRQFSRAMPPASHRRALLTRSTPSRHLIRGNF